MRAECNVLSLLEHFFHIMQCTLLLIHSVALLQILKQLQNSPHACQLIEHGTHQGHDYIVMELLGCNAVELRKSQAPRGRWGTHTVKQLGERAGMMATLLECCLPMCKG